MDLTSLTLYYEINAFESCQRRSILKIVSLATKKCRDF